jgi:hypothetical protein
MCNLGLITRRSRGRENWSTESIPVQTLVDIDGMASTVTPDIEKHNHKNEQEHQDDNHSDEQYWPYFEAEQAIACPHSR